MDAYEAKVARLCEGLGRLPGALVAFSGGVDSTLLLRASVDVLGAQRVIAVTADSPSYPRAERDEAIDLAASCGVRHELLRTQELLRDGYRQNQSDRCYFCKQELFETVASRIREQDLPDWPLLYGAILDDLSEHRPGQRAAGELGVKAPLAEAGFDKNEVRRYSRELGLPTADKPSFACLASRVPYGTSIDAELLARVELAEEYLRQRGFRQFRVRHHDKVARVELAAEDLARAAGPERAGIVRHMKSLGYAYVALDLEGFRSGSMNETLGA